MNCQASYFTVLWRCVHEDSRRQGYKSRRCSEYGCTMCACVRFSPPLIWGIIIYPGKECPVATPFFEIQGKMSSYIHWFRDARMVFRKWESFHLWATENLRVKFWPHHKQVLILYLKFKVAIACKDTVAYTISNFMVFPTPWNLFCLKATHEPNKVRVTFFSFTHLGSS